MWVRVILCGIVVYARACRPPRPPWLLSPVLPESVTQQRCLASGWGRNMQSLGTSSPCYSCVDSGSADWSGPWHTTGTGVTVLCPVVARGTGRDTDESPIYFSCMVVYLQVLVKSGLVASRFFIKRSIFDYDLSNDGHSKTAFLTSIWVAVLDSLGQLANINSSPLCVRLSSRLN